MTATTIERLRAGYEAIARGDVAAALEQIDADVEIHDRPESPDAGTYHGHEGVREALQLNDETFERFDFVPEEYHDFGNRIVVVIRMRAVGKGSGAHVEERIAHLWTVRDDRAAHLQVYSDPEEALRVAAAPD